MQPDLRLDPERLDVAADRTALLAADVASLAGRARDGDVPPGLSDLPDRLDQARRTLADTAEVLRRTATALRDRDHELARRFR